MRWRQSPHPTAVVVKRRAWCTSAPAQTSCLLLALPLWKQQHLVSAAAQRPCRTCRRPPRPSPFSGRNPSQHLGTRSHHRPLARGSATKLAHACPLFSILSSPGAASWLEYARKLLVSGQEGGGYKFQGPQPSSRKLTFRSSTASNICPVTTRAGQVAALLQTFPPMF